MKRIITLFSLTVATMASAASIDWSVAAKSFGTSDGSSERAENYLVLIYEASSWSDASALIASLRNLDESAAATTFSQLTSLSVDSGKTAKTGKASGTYSSDVPSKTNVSLYALAVDAENLADASHFMYTSDPVTSQAYVTPDVPASQGAFTAQSFGGTWAEITKTGGDPTIPEPATGALALAGVALLFKRRRA